MIVTCPRCFSADDVEWQRLPDKMIAYTCRRAHSAGSGETAGPHTWVGTVDAVSFDADTSQGVTDELMEPLTACVVSGEPFVEYGIVEYRFARAHPDLFAAHIAERGHTMLHPQVATASGVRFGVALGRLAAAGALVSKYGPATGAWGYNGQVTYWSKQPPGAGKDVTWVTFCAERGRSTDWIDEDRALARGG